MAFSTHIYTINNPYCRCTLVAQQQAIQRVKLPFGQVVYMLGSYVRAKVVEQIKNVALMWPVPTSATSAAGKVLH